MNKLKGLRKNVWKVKRTSTPVSKGLVCDSLLSFKQLSVIKSQGQEKNAKNLYRQSIESAKSRRNKKSKSPNAAVQNITGGLEKEFDKVKKDEESDSFSKIFWKRDHLGQSKSLCHGILDSELKLSRILDDSKKPLEVEPPEIIKKYIEYWDTDSEDVEDTSTDCSTQSKQFSRSPTIEELQNINANNIHQGEYDVCKTQKRLFSVEPDDEYLSNVNTKLSILSAQPEDDCDCYRKITLSPHPFNVLPPLVSEMVPPLVSEMAADKIELQRFQLMNMDDSFDRMIMAATGLLKNDNSRNRRFPYKYSFEVQSHDNDLLNDIEERKIQNTYENLQLSNSGSRSDECVSKSFTNIQEFENSNVKEPEGMKSANVNNNFSQIISDIFLCEGGITRQKSSMHKSCFNQQLYENDNMKVMKSPTAVDNNCNENFSSIPICITMTTGNKSLGPKSYFDEKISEEEYLNISEKLRAENTNINFTQKSSHSLLCEEPMAKKNNLSLKRCHKEKLSGKGEVQASEETETGNENIECRQIISDANFRKMKTKTRRSSISKKRSNKLLSEIDNKETSEGVKRANANVNRSQIISDGNSLKLVTIRKRNLSSKKYYGVQLSKNDWTEDPARSKIRKGDLENPIAEQNFLPKERKKRHTRKKVEIGTSQQKNSPITLGSEVLLKERETASTSYPSTSTPFGSPAVEKRTSPSLFRGLSPVLEEHSNTNINNFYDYEPTMIFASRTYDKTRRYKINSKEEMLWSSLLGATTDTLKNSSSIKSLVPEISEKQAEKTEGMEDFVLFETPPPCLPRNRVEKENKSISSSEEVDRIMIIKGNVSKNQKFKRLENNYEYHEDVKEWSKMAKLVEHFEEISKWTLCIETKSV